MMQFAAIEAAMAIRQQAFTEYMATPEPPRNDRAARDAWREAEDRSEAAEAVVDAASATELLPAILAGEWVRTDATLKAPAPDRFSGTCTRRGSITTTFLIIPCISGARAPKGCSR